MDPVNLESILVDVGPFGAYQKVRLFLIGIPAGVLPTMSMVMLYFMTYIPPHMCDVAEKGTPKYSLLPSQLQNLVEQNYSRDDFMKYSRPTQILFDQPVWSQCSLYDFQNNTMESIIDQVNANMTNLTTMSCPAGMWYGDDYGRTIIVEWDLICEKDFVRNAIMSLSTITAMVGLMLFSYLQDKIGRKITFMLVLTWYIIFGIASALIQNVLAFGILWSMKCMATYPMMIIPNVWMMEIVGPEMRTFASSYLSLMCSVGLPITVMFAYCFRDYVTLIWIATIPAIPLYLFWFLLDESPRWLLLVGRNEEAKKIIRKMARINGKNIDERKLDGLVADTAKKAYDDKTAVEKTRSDNAEPSSDAKGESPEGRNRQCCQRLKMMSTGYLQLFSRPNIAIKTLIITYLYIVCGVVMYGVALTVETFASDRYLTFILLGLSEFPAIGFVYLALDRVGRVSTVAVVTTLAGISSILTGMIPGTNIHMTLVCFLLTKFFIESSANIIRQASGEIFPTMVRGTAIGFSALISDVLESVTPFIIYASYSLNFASLPMFIFGGLAIVGGLVAFFLPEMSHKPLPDTIEESETQMPTSMKTFYDNITFRRAVSVYREFQGLKRVDMQEPAEMILMDGNEVRDHLVENTT